MLQRSILGRTGVAQSGRGAGLRNQLMRVRIPPPVPKNCKCGIANFESHAVAKFAIRDFGYVLA